MPSETHATASSFRRKAPGPRARARLWLTAVLATLAACGGSEPDPTEPPAGAEAVPEGDAFELGGLRYQVDLARQINPNIAPGSDYYQGPGAPPGSLLFAVFLTACNEGEQTRPAAERLRLVTAFGDRLRPKTLPDANVFAYQARPVEPATCIPREDSAAARAAEGAMLLFEIPLEKYNNVQLKLEVTAPDGDTSRLVELDV